MHARYFERQDPTALQFWAIILQDQSFQIHQGKVGTAGKSQLKDCGDHSTCARKAAQQIQTQVTKGFSELDLGHPENLGELSSLSYQSILSLPTLPPAFFEWATQTSSPEVQKAIANHPQATRLALETLVQSSYADVIELAQLHINLAGEITEGWQEEAIARLKALDLNPKRKSVLELAAFGIIPDFLLDSLVLELRVAIAKQPETDPQILAQLARDFHENVRKAIATNPNTPPEILEQLVADRVLEVRVALAKNASTPPAALLKLADDVYEKVKKIVLKHPNVPGDAVFKLQHLIDYEQDYALAKIASQPTTSISTIEQLAQREEYHIRRGVAENLNTPVELLTRLAFDSIAYVRKGVAANPNTPGDVLVEMLGDVPPIHPIVASWAGKHRSAINNADLVIVPIIDATPEDVWAMVMQNPSLPSFKVEEFVRRQAQNLTSKDNDFQLFIASVAHPNIPVSLLEWLLGDEFRQLYLDAYYADRQKQGSRSITHPNHPIKVMTVTDFEFNKLTWETETELRAHCDRFALNQLNHLYDAIAQHPKMLKQSSFQPSDSPIEEPIQNTVVANPKPSKSNLHEIALSALAQSKCSWSRLVALMHVQTPSSMLATAVGSEYWWERYAIAQNPNTPEKLIKHLAEDHNCLVRAAAKANLSEGLGIVD
ncbi:MAG: WGR domain-containing protein [Thermosynechococcaceae cyanobacterium]